MLKTCLRVLLAARGRGRARGRLAADPPARRRRPPHRACRRRSTRRTSRPGRPTAWPPRARRSGCAVSDARVRRGHRQALVRAGLERRRQPARHRRPLRASDPPRCAGWAATWCPSFGGYSADHGGTEIADSCTDVDSWWPPTSRSITTLGVTRLDMDVEDRSLGHTAGIDRRNEALARVERWAARTGRTAAGRVHAADHAHRPRVRRPGGAAERDRPPHPGRHRQHHDLRLLRRRHHRHGRRRDRRGPGPVRAAASALPGASGRAELWAMEGNTILPGIDDYPQDRGDHAARRAPAAQVRRPGRARRWSRSGRSSATTAADT